MEVWSDNTSLTEQEDMDMGIKVEVNGAGEGNRAYPYIGVRDGQSIVLFTRKGVGTLLRAYVAPMGFHSVTWDESEFTPLVGSITLSND